MLWLSVLVKTVYSISIYGEIIELIFGCSLFCVCVCEYTHAWVYVFMWVNRVFACHRTFLNVREPPLISDFSIFFETGYLVLASVHTRLRGLKSSEGSSASASCPYVEVIVLGKNQFWSSCVCNQHCNHWTISRPYAIFNKGFNNFDINLTVIE